MACLSYDRVFLGVGKGVGGVGGLTEREHLGDVGVGWRIIFKT